MKDQYNWTPPYRQTGQDDMLPAHLRWRGLDDDTLDKLTQAAWLHLLDAYPAGSNAPAEIAASMSANADDVAAWAWIELEQERIRRRDHER